MNTKEWLKKGWNLNKEVKSLQCAKEKALSAACNASQVLSSTPKSGGGNSSETKFTEYSDFSLMLDERMKELDSLKAEILSAINTVGDSTHRTILIERYINFKTWEQIAVDMSYSCDYVYELHENALRRIKITQ